MNFEIKINDKICLRIPSLNNSQDLFDAVDKDRIHLGEWLDWVDKTKSFKDTENNIKERIEGFENKKSASFIIYYEDKCIGSIGFIEINEKHKKGEIGYWLASNFGGKGIMTDCVKAVINYGFNSVNLNRIIIKCDSKNTKSIAIPKKLGFILEGTLRQDRLNNNIFSDMMVFGMLKKDWKIL